MKQAQHSGLVNFILPRESLLTFEWCFEMGGVYMRVCVSGGAVEALLAKILFIHSP